MRPSSPLSSRACLIETSWWGFWAAMCGSSQRDSGSRSQAGYLSCPPWLCCQTKVMYLLRLVISQAAKKRKLILFWALDGQKRKLWLWFRLHSLTMCYFYSLFLLFFAHSVIFLCKWMEWPNFTRLYCVWMSRCNLTKCCSESWLYGLSFQTQQAILTSYALFLFVCVYMCSCLLTCISP